MRSVLSILADFDKIMETKTNHSYDYSCSMIELDPKIEREIRDFVRREIPRQDIFWGNDEIGDDFGIPENVHVTVVYGYKTSSAIDILNSFNDFKKDHVDMVLGDLRMFSHDYYDVLYLSVTSRDLEALRNMSMNSGLDIDMDYPVYTPHITLAYMKKEARDFTERMVGNKIFDRRPARGINLRITTVTGTDCLYSLKRTGQDSNKISYNIR